MRSGSCGPLRRFGVSAATAVSVVIALLASASEGASADDAATPRSELPNVAACVDGHMLDYRETDTYSRLASVVVEVSPCTEPETTLDEGVVTISRSDTGDVLASWTATPTRIGDTYAYESRGTSLTLPARDTTYPVTIQWAPDGKLPVTLESSVVTSAGPTTIDQPTSTFRGDGTTLVHLNLLAPGAGAVLHLPARHGTVTVSSAGTVLGRADVSTAWDGTVPLTRATEGEVVQVAYSGDDFYDAATTSITMDDWRPAPSLRVTASDHYGLATIDIFATAAATPGYWSSPFGASTTTISIDGRVVRTIVFGGQLGGSTPDPAYLHLQSQLQVAGGKHVVSVHFGGDDSYHPVTASTTLVTARIPVTVGTTSPARRTTTERGRSVTMLFTVTDLFARSISVPVQVQTREPSSSAWRTLRTVTSKNGYAETTLSETSSHYYRIVTPATASYEAGIGAQVRIDVRRHVSLHRIRTSASKAVIEAVATPTGSVVIQERVHGTWHTRATLRPRAGTGQTGTVQYTVKRSTSTRTLRVVVHADSAGTSAVSSSVTVPRRH